MNKEAPMPKIYELCPQCLCDVDDMTDEGICEVCLSTPEQKKRARYFEAVNALEAGHDVDMSQFFIQS